MHEGGKSANEETGLGAPHLTVKGPPVLYHLSICSLLSMVKRPTDPLSPPPACLHGSAQASWPGNSSPGLVTRRRSGMALQGTWPSLRAPTTSTASKVPREQGEGRWRVAGSRVVKATT